SMAQNWLTFGVHASGKEPSTRISPSSQSDRTHLLVMRTGCLPVFRRGSLPSGRKLSYQVRHGARNGEAPTRYRATETVPPQYKGYGGTPEVPSRIFLSALLPQCRSVASYRRSLKHPASRSARIRMPTFTRFASASRSFEQPQAADIRL